MGIDDIFTKSPTGKPVNKKFACTIVSMLPFELNEDKPHMLPSSYRIPAAVNGKYGIAHIEEGIHYIPNPLIEEGKPGSSIKQTTMPDEMARSVVEDYVTAQVSLGENASPGIFFVPGRLTLKEVRENYPELISHYEELQKNWFRNLCALADADWSKNHNLLSVSDLQRAAAKSLGIVKDWVEMRVEETTACPMCKTNVNPEAIVCMNCKAILKPEQYKREMFANA